MGDERRALFIAWLLLSAVGGAVVAAGFVFQPGQLAGLLPTCDWRARYGVDCVLCGMTRAFIAIAGGDWRLAHTLHRGSVPLFSILAGNAVVAAAAAGRWSARRLSSFLVLKETA